MRGSITACVCLADSDPITVDARDSDADHQFLVIDVARSVSIILPGVDAVAVQSARALIAALDDAARQIEHRITTAHLAAQLDQPPTEAPS